jgi:predicted metal-dependent enzyme (double-stranded beta helix superfamily)
MTSNNRPRDNSTVSRRETMGAIGLGLLSIPSLALARAKEMRPSAAVERIIPTSKQNEIEMQKFVEDCIAANKDSDPQAAVKEVLARGVHDHGAMLKAAGEPKEAGLKVFHRSKTLTIFAACWTPQMNLMPHNHLMWAAIGIYTGREDNILWRKKDGDLKAHDVRCLFAGDVATLSEKTIHSVTNPLERFTGGLHIYGGDFFATERSQWDPETLDEEPSNGAVIRDIFKRANERMQRLGER